MRYALVFALVACTGTSGGDYFGCAIADDQTITCWGYPSLHREPIEPPAGRYIAISAGEDHSCAVGDGGSVACWGTDLYGETMPPEPPAPSF